MEGRPRFNAALDGNIAQLIFCHIHHELMRRICRGVCKAWYALVAFSYPVNHGMFEDFIRDYADEHMECMRPWMPRFSKITMAFDQVGLIGCCVKYDKPKALSMILAHSDVDELKTSTMILKDAIYYSARKVIAQLLLPIFSVNGNRCKLFTLMFQLASLELFAWYLSSFPQPLLHANNIQFHGEEPIEVEEKIKLMHAKCQIAIGWWKQWFLKAAGVRGRFHDVKGKLHYREANPDDEYKYNETIATAIVHHVLNGVIPEEGHEYLSNHKIKINKQRNAALLSRLKRRKV